MSTVATRAATSPSRHRDIGLVGWQIRYEQRAFWRNRVRAIFTFMFPLMFLLIFGSIYHNTTIPSLGGLKYDEFFVPGILAYGVISATYINLAISTAVLRDEGVLKRMQGTPLPTWAYVLGRIGSTLIIVAVMTIIVLVVGALAFSVHIRASTLPGLIVTLALGCSAFTTLGIGVVRLIPNAEAAPVVVNLTVLPLTFISSIWFPIVNMPQWLQTIAKIFPIEPLAAGLQYAFNPHTTGAGFLGRSILTLAIWTAVGVYLMIRFLRKPQGEAGSG